jgi:hypothetical protein
MVRASIARGEGTKARAIRPFESGLSRLQANHELLGAVENAHGERYPAPRTKPGLVVELRGQRPNQTCKSRTTRWARI